MLLNIGDDKERHFLALQALLNPDDSRDDVLRKITQLAARMLKIPGSFISVLDDENQYVRAAINFQLQTSSRVNSFCRYAVDSGNPFIVPDTLQDARFVTHPLTVASPFIRFYAGVPLTTRDGITLGTLCVVDTNPHTVTKEQIDTLRLLGELAMSFLEAWHYAGLTDAITGLPNKLHLLRDIQLLNAANDTAERNLILIDCIDMPRAFELARTRGMAPVENLLRDMAIMLPLRLRPLKCGKLYMVATGRFALLTRASDNITACAIASRLQGVSAELEPGITVEFRVHTAGKNFTPGDVSAREVLNKAVHALHERIRQNTFQLPETIIDEDAAAMPVLMKELSQAIDGKLSGLYLVYQPKMCLQTDAPVGIEALIRWRHPQKGELSPGMFIPFAEQAGLLQDLTGWVIANVITQLAAWHALGLALPVSVNVSIQDISAPGFADSLEARMIRARLPTSLLGIECLETERIIESAAALKGLEMLKLRGFPISLDDFGTGYSNISYLRRMPIDIIKLDQSLISKLSEDTASRIIARSIIGMLKELDYVVLAEGVENAQTGETLQKYGCDQAQGYLYARPLPAQEMSSWLEWKIRV
ncbi:sensor domain-containing phosphodiesterase [Kosakonia cowanii]|uniref:GGDEF domain-containing phosphodiesterase n=1 Tax=Kosakonia cowanii TaxID=208223 RepID=UPI000B97C71F|nr:EAL domain-containing protein [Kosakonia cowanii]AST70372.1 sensor domain-containing phosphodiesterase [Kosakonia cowanii]